ncbi:MAG: class I SAM-dependent methyltransferase [Kitasatospora sp.]|nr:class I SAM-dependent methyltransferase [Kitasatospora sp.]
MTESLRTAYDGAVEHRDRTQKEPWKITERAGFLRRLQGENCRRLLELGAGTGQDSAFFAGHGLQVVATDLSPQMVARCREKGLDARVMDFLHLDFPAGSFDAAYALNSLLHVPNADLPAILEVIASVLRPGGLFFLGVYGHDPAQEGPLDDGIHHPPRFFSWRTDEQIQQFARGCFDIVDFHVVGLGQRHFQSLTLRRPGPAPA